MKETIKKLLTIKSLVTLATTAVFAYLSVKGTISSDQFLVIFTSIIAFYFGTQHEKLHTTE